MSAQKFRWWMFGVPVALIVLAGAIVALILNATNAILTSADGELTEVILDPTAEGYEIYITPTPSYLGIVEDQSGELISVVVISLFPNDIGGSLIVLPSELLIGEEMTAGEIYNINGVAGLEQSVGDYFTVGFDSTGVLSNDFWIEHFSQIGEITVEIDDPLTTSEDGQQIVVFDSGNISVAPERLDDFIAWENPSESPYNRWVRNQRFWSSWVDLVRTTDIDLENSDSSEPQLMRMLAALGRGEMLLFEPPLVAESSSRASFSTNRDDMKSLILQMIPFPTSASSGSRPKVKLLDGIGGLDLPNSYVPPLVASGAQILLLGNAETYGVDKSQIIYHNESLLPLVNDFSNAISGAELTYDPITETAIDVTVIIGRNSLGLD